MSKQPLQAIFFDFDGVLVDSTRTKTEAFRTLFQEYGEETINEVVAYHRQNGGISRVVKIQYSHEHIIGSPLTKKELQRWAKEYSQLVVNEVIASPWIQGAENFLKEMKNALPLFVISGTPEDELQYIIDRRQSTHYFKECLGSPTTKPDHIHRLLKTYNFSRDQVVFIGDALTDYSAAKETGLPFLGIHGEIDFPLGTRVIPDCVPLLPTLLERFIL